MLRGSSLVGMIALALICFLTIFTTPTSAGAIDIAYGTGVGAFECFKKWGAEMISFQGTVGKTGNVEMSLADGIRNAVKGGFKQSEIGIEFQPCFVACTKFNTTEQIQAMEKVFAAQSFKPGIIWITMGQGTVWKDRTSANQILLENIIAYLQMRGYNWGIFSKANAWASIVGGQYALPGNVPLKTIDAEDDKTTCDIKNWMPFGNWSKPTWKRYKSDPMCACDHYKLAKC